MNLDRYVPPVRTPVSPLILSRGYRAAVQELTGMAPTPRAVSVLHAHGAFETGHADSCICGNIGNVKPGTKWDGDYTCITLNERVHRGGKKVTVWFAPQGELTDAPARGGVVTGVRFYVPPGHPQTRMRAYPGATNEERVAAGIRDKISFLLQPYWRGALDLALAGDPHGYCEALRDRGYFTAELGPYARGVYLLTQKFEPIAREDQEHPRGLHTDQEQQIECDMVACYRGDPRWIFSPDPNWDAVRAARDAEIRGDT